jgi:hypothetical protein
MKTRSGLSSCATAVWLTAWLRFCRVSTTNRSAIGTEGEAPPEPGAAVRDALVRQPDRHPLQVGLVGQPAAHEEVALGLGLVVLAPVSKVSLVTSWSSKMTIHGTAACAACRSGSDL